MEFIADGLLIVTAMTAGLYCMVLSRRLRRLTESGDSIGSQVDALDLALAETRSALRETREGVSELRSSTKVAIGQLSRGTAQGEEMAERIESGVVQAKATMQRLYEARDRIEAYESRQGEKTHTDEHSPENHAESGLGDNTLVIETQSGDDQDIPDEFSGEVDETIDEATARDDAKWPKVTLPDGKVVEPEAVPAESPETLPENTAETSEDRSGAILKAERVML